MNYSFMTFSTPELALPEILDAAVKYGYQGVEIRIAPSQKHGIDIQKTEQECSDIKQMFEQKNIKLCCLATSSQFANADTVTEEIDNVKKYLKLASDLEIPRMRVFGGYGPEGQSRDKGKQVMTDAFKEIAPYAEQAKCTICLETHDNWTNPSHVADVMKQVDHPAIAVNWDIMHPVRQSGWNIDDAFNTLKPWIKHVHFHDGVNDESGNVTLKPIGQGMIDHYRALELLINMGYKDFMSGEWIGWEPYDIHLPRELKTMKEYEKKITWQ
jgi:sugar phosphate isomerase/epimerase